MTPAQLKAMSDGNIENLIAASTPGGIEAQEKRGQLELCASSRLPKNGPWDELKALGIEVVGETDDLFFDVKLPTGWKLQETEHSMWSHLLDDKGTQRASIFYKAAFYDRDAFIRLASSR